MHTILYMRNGFDKRFGRPALLLWVQLDRKQPCAENPLLRMCSLLRIVIIIHDICCTVDVSIDISSIVATLQ